MRNGLLRGLWRVSEDDTFYIQPLSEPLIGIISSTLPSTSTMFLLSSRSGTMYALSEQWASDTSFAQGNAVVCALHPQRQGGIMNEQVVPSVQSYEHQLFSVTSANRINCFTLQPLLQSDAGFANGNASANGNGASNPTSPSGRRFLYNAESTRLTNDFLHGNRRVTSFAFLPLNRQMLFGLDSGEILLGV